MLNVIRIGLITRPSAAEKAFSFPTPCIRHSPFPVRKWTQIVIVITIIAFSPKNGVSFQEKAPAKSFNEIPQPTTPSLLGMGS